MELLKNIKIKSGQNAKYKKVDPVFENYDFLIVIVGISKIRIYTVLK